MMPIDIFLSLGYLWLALWGATMMCFVASLLLHFFVPKAMLKAYFKEPYFSSAEIAFFSGFPFAYMRTAMFMRLAAFPGSGRKRGIPEDVCLLASAWFQKASSVLVIAFCTLALPMMVLGCLLGVWALVGVG